MIGNAFESWFITINLTVRKKLISNKKVKCFTDCYLVQELIEDFLRYSNDLKFKSKFNSKSNFFNPQMSVLQFTSSEMVFDLLNYHADQGSASGTGSCIPRSRFQKSGTETRTHNKTVSRGLKIFQGTVAAPCRPLTKTDLSYNRACLKRKNQIYKFV